MASLILKTAAIAAISLSLVGCQSVRERIPGMKSSTPKATKAAKVKEAAPTLGVNAFLWRASLETLNFMPLESVDPFGGVITTDWYANPEEPNERFKSNVYILDTQLRADALKVGVFKQTRGAGGWVDASVDADTARQIENAILTRARELYIASN